jgi:hypothetical protein
VQLRIASHSTLDWRSGNLRSCILEE